MIKRYWNITNPQIATTINSSVKGFHLYIINDDVIKEGDWYINLEIKEIYQAFSETPLHELNGIDKHIFKKVIASNNSLIHLPQLPQQFIEEYIAEYNKKINSGILVEYEYFVENGEIDIFDDQYEIIYPEKCSMRFGYLSDIEEEVNVKKRLKINSDNISIKHVCGIEEIIEFIEKLPKNGWVRDTTKSTYIRQAKILYNLSVPVVNIKDLLSELYWSTKLEYV